MDFPTLVTGTTFAYIESVNGTSEALQAVERQVIDSVKLKNWIEIIAYSSAVAFALAVLLAFLGAFTAAGEPAIAEPVAAAEPSPARSVEGPMQSYEGMVTDTRCGARHQAALGRNASDCTRSCVHAGEQFALVNGEKVYVLTGDLEALKRSAGHRSKVLGTQSGNTILVSSINDGM